MSHKITREKVSTLLKSFMEKKLITGKEMAKYGGITEQAFSGYIREKNLPAAPVLARWATELGMNINWLLTGEGPMLRDENLANHDLRAEIETLKSELLRLYKKHEDTQEEINQLLRLTSSKPSMMHEDLFPHGMPKKL